MELNIDDLIIRPGHFVLEPGKRFKVTGAVEGKKLNIFSDSEAAEKVYKAYDRCYSNAVALTADAELLFQAGRFARACALAIIAWEELGKSQIAADYYSGVLTEAEYKAAFKEHRLKTSYLNRAGAINSNLPDRCLQYDDWPSLRGSEASCAIRIRGQQSVRRDHEGERARHHRPRQRAYQLHPIRRRVQWPHRLEGAVQVMTAPRNAGSGAPRARLIDPAGPRARASRRRARIVRGATPAARRGEAARLRESAAPRTPALRRATWSARESTTAPRRREHAGPDATRARSSIPPACAPCRP